MRGEYSEHPSARGAAHPPGWVDVGRAGGEREQRAGARVLALESEIFERALEELEQSRVGLANGSLRTRIVVRPCPHRAIEALHIVGAVECLERGESLERRPARDRRQCLRRLRLAPVVGKRIEERLRVGEVVVEAPSRNAKRLRQSGELHRSHTARAQ
jgi:hypothetical protein